ncbi:MAG TPA: PQQ-binding-like beta-propeller repeat protein [Vicinamibacterales bacterium]|nr:PQQ-binding-like beta-propeller repeat protein [Vicinamibacterales bacterium]
MFKTLALAAVVAALLSISGQAPVSGEWRFYSGDNGSTKYSSLDQIDKSNVGSLKIAWRRPQVDASLLQGATVRIFNNFRSTPIMVGGVLYASNGVGLAEAFDPETGNTLWVQKPGADGTGTDAIRGSANRGVAYWGTGNDARIITFRNRYLYALNPKTGEPIATFGKNGVVDLGADVGPRSTGYRWASVPLIARDVIVMGSAMVDQDSATKIEGDPGDVRAYDVRTGKLRWTFHVVPKADDAEALKTWVGDSWQYTGAGNVWSLMSADDELGYVYLPTTSVTNDMYGGARLGDNLYSTSIVCLDAATGKRVWHYQTVHHDLFDYDNPAAPIIADISVDGKRIKAVVQITKQSWAYVLDRATGKPVWPIVEKPVPPSTVPGEKASPTQPIPSKPPAFDRQGITENDLIDFTPELRAEALAIFRKYRSGPVFTPPSVAGEGANDLKGTIELPGSIGGADWTGAAFDPETGMLYVPSMTNPFVANLIPGDPTKSNLRYVASTRELLQGPRGLPLVKPPYGRITALDLNRGELRWTIANGDGPRFHPELKALNLPPLGQSVRAAPLVTKTLLFVTEGDQINVRTPPNGGGKKIRAYDKATGQVLWETQLEAGSTGTLMTYLHKGKQYLVVAIGGVQHPAEFVAFSLQ